MKLNFLKSEFAKNVFTLMTGTTIAQALPIAVTPILTRLYTPEDFGVFALFLSITSITGVVANAQYEQAIVLPQNDRDALNLVYLSVLIALGISTILLLIVFFFKEPIAFLLDNNKIKNWLYLVPLSTFLVGTYNSLNFFNIRKKKFKRTSVSLVTKSTSLTFFQVLLGSNYNGPLGLVLGQVSSFLFGNTILYKTLKENKKVNFCIDKAEIKNQAIKYKKFPFFSLPSVFINSVNLNAINFLISSVFSTKILGFYSLTQRIVGIPSRLIGNSMGQVYFQRASLDFNEKGNTHSLFKKMLKKLSLFSILMFGVIFFSSEWVFEIIFGEEWKIAGVYAKILAPLGAVRFVSSTLSSTITIHEKQEYGLVINIILLSSTLILFFVASFLRIEFENLLILYTLTFIIEYLLFLLFYFKISRG